MSRIDEALRRAGSGATPPDVDPLDGVWQFDERPADAPAAGIPKAEPARDRQTSPVLTPLRTTVTTHTPSQNEAVRGPLADALTGNEKLVGGALAPPLVEEYRKLAANLHQAQIDRGVKVVLVASAVPGEGKTLTAANLALTLSLSYARRTLLIDADLRRPSIHEVFRLPVSFGLSEGLSADEETRVSAVQLSSTLALLPAGRPVANPVPLLTSPRMQQLVDDARQYFDWVVIDTPPVGLLTDANLLVTTADTSLLVINAGRTQHALVEKAVMALGRPHIFGVVLNHMDDALPGSNSYSGYYNTYLPAER